MCSKSAKTKRILLHHVLPLFFTLCIGFTAGYFTGYKVATDKCISTNLIQDNQEIDDYYNLLDTVVTDIFVPNNISYWLIGGSLIGSIRSRPPGPLAHDDDFDVGAFREDLPIIISALKNHPHLEYHEGGFGLQIDFISSAEHIKVKRFDIFTFSHFDKGVGGNGAGYYILGDNGIQGSNWPGSYFTDKTEILPLRDCLLWDIKVKCPNESKKILAREYGQEAFTKMIKWNHSNDGNGEKVDLTDPKNAQFLLPMMNKKLIEKLHFGQHDPLKSYDEF